MKHYLLCILVSVISFVTFLHLSRPVYAVSSQTRPVAIASIPRATHTLATETILGQQTYVLYLNNTAGNPDYKWQFLMSGLRVFIDNKDGLGWLPVAESFAPSPEYMKQLGQARQYIWQPYNLTVNTTGSNVLGGFTKQEQPDGSIKMVRTYATKEEGVAETLTESWMIPSDTEDFGKKGLKVSYNMTKNRGIQEINGVKEGTWRLHWQVKGLSDISKSTTDERGSNGKPLARKGYYNGEFTIDVKDFIDSQNNSDYAFNEDGDNNQTDVIFFKNGTSGGRVVDPTVAATVASGWKHNHQHNVFYNGTNFFVFYFKGSTAIFFKAASTVAGLNSATEQTLIGTIASNTEWDIYPINDTKFDVGYFPDTTHANAQTCTISGTSISCGGAPTAFSDSSQINMCFAYSPGGNRVYMYDDNLGDFHYTSTGDITSSSTWSLAGGSPNQGIGFTSANECTAMGYSSSDKVLFIMEKTATTASILGDTVTTAGTSNDMVVKAASGQGTAPKFGSAVRISDTDFRFAFVDTSATTKLIEAQFNGNATWAITTNIDTGGSQTNPTLFYDRTDDVEYAFYVDGSSPKTIQEYKKTTASTYSNVWGSKTNVGDTTGSNADSLPVTQMVEAPPGSSRTAPLELTWGFRRVNSTNFDVMVGDTNLVSAGPTQVAFTNSANSTVVGGCSAVFTIQLQNGSGVATNPTGTTVIQITSNTSGSYAIFSDTGCNQQISSGNITFTTSQNTQSFYIQDNAVSGTTWTATATKTSGPDTISAGTQTYTITAHTNQMNVQGGTTIQGGTQFGH